MQTHVYTRHKSQCPHRAKPAHRGCRCPKWIYVERTRQRISAKTRSWEAAEEKARVLADGKPAAKNTDEVIEEDKPVAVADVAEKKTTIYEAIEQFLEDKRVQNLAESTLYKLVKGFALDIPSGYGSQEAEARIAAA